MHSRSRTNGREFVPDPESREPVLTRAGLTAMTALVVAVGVRAGLPVSEGAAELIALAILAASPLVAGWWARRKTWSGATVARMATARGGAAEGRG